MLKYIHHTCLYLVLAGCLIKNVCASIVKDDFKEHKPNDAYVDTHTVHRRANQMEPVKTSSLTAAGFLFAAQSTGSRLDPDNPIDATISRILDRNGPDMRPSRDYKDFNDISLDVSKRAWKLLHKQATVAINDKIDLAKPAIDQVLIGADVSSGCKESVNQLFEGAKRMESWAVKILNSWGNFPPVGIFEGTYSEMGSFHSCLDQPRNKFIDHAHYCSITYRPIMPSRKDYELVVRKEPDELLRLFDYEKPTINKTSTMVNDGKQEKKDEYPQVRDAFKDLLEHAQYHHYVYYKWGTCWPIKCTPFDVRRVAKLLGRMNILMNGPVKCYSKKRGDYEYHESNNATTNGSQVNNAITLREEKKLVISVWDKNDGIFIWKPFFNRTQKVALGIIVIVSLFILTITLIDLFINRIPRLYHYLTTGSTGRHETCINNHSRDRNTNQLQICDNNNNRGLASGDEDNNKFALLGGENQQNSAQQNVGDVTTEPSIQTCQGYHKKAVPRNQMSTFWAFVDDCSIITNAGQFFRVSEGQMKNDILCLNGIRCITMIWIIMTHTMMYNDWSAFARTREIEKTLNSMISQPLFNGSYLVDTFFLMSGLLSAYTAFRHCQGLLKKFNSFAYIFGRWLRLTPQIFFVSMIYIIIPAVSSGPHWFPVVAEYSENCVENWWINVLHVQSFFEKEKMCNFVTWWISIDFFYHFFALAVIWIILLTGHKIGFLSIGGLILSQVAWQSIRHYQAGYPPNIFATIPQTGAMWTEMTLSFSWTPYTHAVPFFFGFYLGYMMALKQKLILRFLNFRVALIGWTVSASLLIAQAYSTYWWVTGQASYSKWVATIFYTVCPIIWAGSFCWIIVACHHGYGGFVNRVLSWKVFIVLGKASYLVYLSHFQILFIFYGNQSLLLEPSELVMFYIVVGNILLSTLYGIFLCIVFEIPWLKAQRKLMTYV